MCIVRRVIDGLAVRGGLRLRRGQNTAQSDCQRTRRRNQTRVGWDEAAVLACTLGGVGTASRDAQAKGPDPRFTTPVPVMSGCQGEDASDSRVVGRATGLDPNRAMNLPLRVQRRKPRCSYRAYHPFPPLPHLENQIRPNGFEEEDKKPAIY